MLTFDNAYLKLPDYFFTQMPPEEVSQKPTLMHVNKDVAKLIGLDLNELDDDALAKLFSGSSLFENATPFAQAYSGHQFGQWAGQLGDGRALVLGQVRDKNKELWDVQLKGSGKTPYSRFGDGRAVMRSSIREYLCSEAMAGLGIPTTRALALIATGEKVSRETKEPGAVLTRVARSHIRFGHFEHACHHKKTEFVQPLADHVIEEYYPQYVGVDDKYACFYKDVVVRTASMIAKWQAVGFCHGVMNTDNMSINGITIDYGPFGFLEQFYPDHICNHSDHTGRYSYDQQPAIGYWNLQALAHALKPILPVEQAMEIVPAYEEVLFSHYKSAMRQKIGLKKNEKNHDDLWTDLIELMVQEHADYTLSFRDLAKTQDQPDIWLEHFHHNAKANDWLARYLKLVPNMHENKAAWQEALNAVNPKYVLRNWVAEKVIRVCEDKGDFSEIETMMTLLANPYDEHEEYNDLAALPPKDLAGLCVSCSS